MVKVRPFKNFEGVYQIILDSGERRLATVNLAPGVQVYGERLVKVKGVEYRLWDPYRSKLEELRKKYGKTPAQLIINWVIRHENVIAIPKTLNKKHLDEILGSVGWKMDEEDYEKLPRILSS